MTGPVAGPVRVDQHPDRRLRGVYHPAEFNDGVVLGWKGRVGEAELHLIRSRLTAGLRHKAARGELCQGLPSASTTTRTAGSC